VHHGPIGGTFFGTMRLDEDIQPVSQLKTRAARLLKKLRDDHRPVVITQSGVAQAVLLDVATYEKMRDTLLMLQVVARGDRDVRAGKVSSHADVFGRLEKRLAKRLK
jgi:prevent-host-death family protein